MNQEIFSNSNNYYCAHGTGRLNDSPEIINSIFKIGLRCSHGSLENTVVQYGSGRDDLFNEKKNSFDNWEHINSKKIVIISVPKELYIHYSFKKDCSYKAFEYINDENQNVYLRPEYVRGYYNAETEEFIENPNYYDKLDDNYQRKLYEEVKTNFAKTINELGSSLEEYNSIYENFIESPIPFSEAEIKLYDQMYQKNSNEKDFSR